VAGIIKQQTRQQVVGLVAHDGAVGPLGEGFLPDRIKQRAIHDRRLLAGQNLILEFDLSNIEVVSQHVVQRATAERDPAARRPRGELLGSGSDVAFFEVPDQFVDVAEFQVSPEDQSDPKRYFDVVGCDSGKLYRIYYGTVSNVHEIEADGCTRVGWCFAPAGDLVAGDIMLAQKIALETNEAGMLAIANKFLERYLLHVP